MLKIVKLQFQSTYLSGHICLTAFLIFPLHISQVVLTQLLSLQVCYFFSPTLSCFSPSFCIFPCGIQHHYSANHPSQKTKPHIFNSTFIQSLESVFFIPVNFHLSLVDVSSTLLPLVLITQKFFCLDQFSVFYFQ